MNIVFGIPQTQPTEKQIRQAATRREEQLARRLCCERQHHSFIECLTAILREAAGAQDLRTFVENRLRRQTQPVSRQRLPSPTAIPRDRILEDRRAKTAKRLKQEARAKFSETPDNPCIGESDGSVGGSCMGIGGVLKGPLNVKNPRKPRITIGKFFKPAGTLGDTLLAELKAFMELIQLAHAKGVKHLRAYTDSQMLADFINFDSSTNDLQLLRNREYIREQADAWFLTWSVAWRTREQNTEADELANKGREIQEKKLVRGLARTVEVTPTAWPNLYAVSSPVDGQPYVVDTRPIKIRMKSKEKWSWFCSCPSYTSEMKERCPHMIAVRAYQLRQASKKNEQRTSGSSQSIGQPRPDGQQAAGQKLKPNGQQAGGQKPRSDGQQAGGQKPRPDGQQAGGQKPRPDGQQAGGQKPRPNGQQAGGQKPRLNRQLPEAKGLSAAENRRRTKAPQFGQR